MGDRLLAIIFVVIVLILGIYLVAPQLFKGDMPEQYLYSNEYDSVPNVEIQWQDEISTARDSGAMTDSGVGVDPVEIGAGGDIYVPSCSDDITVGGSDEDHEITLPSTNGTSGYEITEPSYPGNNDPIYTTAGTTVTTARTSITAAKTTTAQLITTTKSTTTRAVSGDNWATLPEDIQEVIISETFEGSLSDFFH